MAYMMENLPDCRADRRHQWGRGARRAALAGDHGGAATGPAHGARLAAGGIRDWEARQQIAEPEALDSDGFVAEVKRLRGKKLPLTAAGLQSLRGEYARSIEPARVLAAEALRLEHAISDLVNQAYGLTPEGNRLDAEHRPATHADPKTGAMMVPLRNGAGGWRRSARHAFCCAEGPSFRMALTRTVLAWRAERRHPPEKRAWNKPASPARRILLPPLQGCTAFRFLSQGAALGGHVAGPLALKGADRTRAADAARRGDPRAASVGRSLRPGER